jgi:hypothetical protein
LGSGGIAPLVLGHLHTPITLLLGKEPYTYSVGGWVSPVADVDFLKIEKYFSPTENRNVTRFSKQCPSH